MYTDSALIDPTLFSKPPLMFQSIILRVFSFSGPPRLDWDPLRFSNGVVPWSCIESPVNETLIFYKNRSMTVCLKHDNIIIAQTNLK